MTKKVITLVLSLLLICTSTVCSMAGTHDIIKLDGKYNKLISVVREDYPDGSYSIEKTYKEVTPYEMGENLVNAEKTKGTDTFSKTKDFYDGGLKHNLLVTAKVKGTFSWNRTTKKVTASDISGSVTYLQGGKIINEKTSISGNKTKKAKGTYSFTRSYKDMTKTKVETDYELSLTCDYKGVNE